MRDPAFCFALLLIALLIQGFVWSIGRDSLELDWWRTLPFAFASVYAWHIVAAMAGWALAGFFYEPERWQRCVMSAVFPALGIVALPIGVWLRKTAFGW